MEDVNVAAMMPRYSMDMEGSSLDMAGTWILHIKSEVLDEIRHNLLPILKYLGPYVPS